jgi:hypothetical protein
VTYATSESGTSFVTAIVSIDTDDEDDAEFNVQCAWEGTDVDSSRPNLVFYSKPEDMKQMVIVAKVDQGENATLVCDAEKTFGTGFQGAVNVRIDSLYGHTVNAGESNNQFGVEPPG